MGKNPAIVRSLDAFFNFSLDVQTVDDVLPSQMVSERSNQLLVLSQSSWSLSLKVCSSTRVAGTSIKPGVEQSETPG
jgi:hypothetical protein